MKKLIAIIAAAASLALPAAAQNDSDIPTSSPGPQTVPLPNINTGGNPTAPAQLPSTAGGNPLQPTFPAGTDKPAWRAGTTGGDQTATGGLNEKQAQRKAAEDRRRAAEPAVNGANPSAPETQVVSPTSPTDQPNPSAPQNNPPQPGVAP